MHHDPNDRFGMPESAFGSAAQSHGRDNPTLRIGMYVPTRREVAELPADDLMYIMDAWMWESPTELIPSLDQIRQVREVLVQRPDREAKDIRALIDLCDRYLGRTESP